MGRVRLLAFVRYNYRMAQQGDRVRAADDWDSFISWLDTLPFLKAGVKPGDTGLEGRHAGAAAEPGGGG